MAPKRANRKCGKLLPMDSQWLITPRTIQIMTIGGIVLLRMNFIIWPSREYTYIVVYLVGHAVTHDPLLRAPLCLRYSKFKNFTFTLSKGQQTFTTKHTGNF